MVDPDSRSYLLLLEWSVGHNLIASEPELRVIDPQYRQTKSIIYSVNTLTLILHYQSIEKIKIVKMRTGNVFHLVLVIQ